MGSQTKDGGEGGMVGKGEESKVGVATSEGELLGVKIDEPPAEAPLLKHPSSFFME